MAITDETYVLLTTFKRSGEGVGTAVWIAASVVLTIGVVLAERNRLVLWANAAVLAVTVLVGYTLARHNPVAWVYGMVAGQVLALVWLLQLYGKDRKDGVVSA